MTSAPVRETAPAAKHMPIAWIDACKGIGIYLVVLGHDGISPALEHFIYLFHMPLFFFLSGYLHSPKHDFRRFFQKKAIHLLLPYASFLALLYPIELARVYVHHGSGAAYAHAILQAVWGGSRLRGLYGVCWFLPCLFLTQQCLNFLLVKWRPVAVGMAVLGSALASYANAYFCPNLSVPLDANVVLAAAPFFYLGFTAASIQRHHAAIAAAAAAGTILAVYLQWRALPLSYDMRNAVYGTPGLTLILSTCCITCVVLISRLAVAASVPRALFTSLGAASMGIMFIHKALPAIPPLARLAISHGYAASLLFTAVSLCLTLLMQRAAVTRALLLGSEKDFHALFDGCFTMPTQVRRSAGAGTANAQANS